MKPRVIGWIAAMGRESPEKAWISSDYILYNSKKKAIEAAKIDLQHFPTVKVYRIFKVEAAFVETGNRPRSDEP